jgi:translation initiation factor IF-2
MSIRLNKIVKELNVGVSTAVEYLQKQGFSDLVPDPNARITDEQYNMLVQKFNPDKDLRTEAEKMMQDRQHKEKEKKKVKAEEIKTVVSGDMRPKFKQVGKIDLGSINHPKGMKPVTTDDTKPETAAAPQQSPEQKSEEPKETKVEAKAETKPEEVKKEKAPAQQPAPAPAETPAPANKPAPQVQNPVPTAAGPDSVEEHKQPAAPVKPTPQQPAAPTSQQASHTTEQASHTPGQEATKEGTAPQQQDTAPEIKPAEQTGPATPAVKNFPNASTDADGIFHLNSVSSGGLKIKVIDKIDLSALNQSTRPKKKSKEEKRKEREGKSQPSTNNATATTEGSGRRRRNRINKERVDVNAVSASNNQPSGNQGGNNHNNNNNNNKRNNGSGPNGAGGSQNANNRRGGNPNNQNNPNAGGNSRRNRKKNLQPIIKSEVSDEDVAKQVKETLARLTNKSKNSKGAKYRKEKRDLVREKNEEIENEEIAESKVLKLTEFVTANELATMMDIPVTKVIATCMSIGIMVSINQRLDAETINLVAEEFGFQTEYVSADVSEAVQETVDDEEDLKPRAPIVTVMGHVDHGKTSLLDYIRRANVIAGEAGGITQHIGAYNVTLESGQHITFLDTPGHEAFTAMRARGAQVTDVAIIIIAADDDIMPQTKEAISHAMAANVPIVFAINKIDKPGANPDKIKEGLAAMNFLVEEWGGKYQSQDISAKKGIGVKELLEKVLLEAEMLDLKANPNRKATGTIIESSLDKGRGYVATVLVANGTLHIGDTVLAGTNFGRVKAMFNERNQRIDNVGPSMAATILGLNGAPQAGDSFHVMESEQEAREIANKREQLQREQGLRTQTRLTLDEVGRRIALGGFQELNVIVKGDVDGSIEALSDSLIKLSTPKIAVNVIHKAVGQISESDVSLAAASDAVIIGFQVRPSQPARRLADQQGVEIRLYSVIYDAIEEVKAAMEGMLAPVLKEEITATLDVRQVYHISKVGIVAGAYVTDGKVKRSDKARLIRDGIVVFTGSINALKRFKDDVKEVTVNFECGISLTNCNDMQEGDIIETFQEVEVKQKL